MTVNYRKTSITLLVICLAALAWFGTIDDYGREYADKGFKRALITFAVARTLNGVISVAQGTEVAVQPAGIGINFTPGQILDPINDLIERFSWVMLASSTSLGLQKMLLAIFSSPAFTAVIMLVLLAAVSALWYPRQRPEWIKPLAYKVALIVLVLRFAIPVIAVASEGIFHLFLEEQYASSTQGIELTTEEITRVNNQTEAQRPITGEDSLLARARRLYDNASASLDIQGYIARYKAAAANASEYAINLIVIFILQTVLIPLLFLWLLVRLVKRLSHLNPLS
jgi:hypothetical protein